MDAPVWSNDLLYLGEMILTLAVTTAIIVVCFYFSRREDRRRAARLAHGGAVSKVGETSVAAQRKSERTPPQR
jgi:hypothetical protein